MSESIKDSVAIDYQVGDIVKFIGRVWGTPHPEIGVVVATDNGIFTDPDDGDLIQIRFGTHLVFIDVSHPVKQIETVSAANEGEA